ncbi:MAG: helix-turn-helix domain-containing protein [Pseudomonadota bacterium]
MRSDNELLSELTLGFDTNERIKAVGAVVAAQLNALADEMAACIRREIPVYAEATDPAFLRSGWKHGLLHAQTIADLLMGKPVGNLKFVEKHAELRADQRLPLNDILHTYRIGHRVTWRCVRAAAMELAPAPEDGLRTAMQLADFTIQYTNLISVVLTRAYTQREKSIRNNRARQAHTLFDELMLGRVTSQSALMLADKLALDERRYQLIATESGDSDVGRTTPTVPVAETLERRLALPDIDVLVDDRPQNPVILVVYHRRAEPIRSRFMVQLETVAAAYDWYVGGSVLGTGSERFADAYAEATAALRYCGSEQRLTSLDEVPLSQLCLDHRHLSFDRLLPHWYRAFHEADVGADHALKQTLVAFADTDLSVKGAATRLGVHPNTVRFRLEKIRAVTGISPKRFRGLQELLTVMALSQSERRNTPLAKIA